MLVVYFLGERLALASLPRANFDTPTKYRNDQHAPTTQRAAIARSDLFCVLFDDG